MVNQTDPYDRRVLLTSDKGDGMTFEPIHKEIGTDSDSDDPVLPIGIIDDDGKWAGLRKSDLGGGSGGAVTIADGDDEALGATTDAESSSGNGSVIAILKNLRTRLGAIEGYVDGLEGFTDGIEAALTTVIGHIDTLEALLSTISGSVDGLEGFTDGIESALTTIIGHVDGIEAALAGTLTVQGTVATTSSDGAHVAIGAITNAESASGDGAVIPILKRVRTLLSGSFAALADALANPTVAAFGAFAHVFNGSTWDRIRGANAAEGTSGTGLLGAGNLIWASGPSIWERWRSISSMADGTAGGNAGQVGPVLSNESTFDRERNVVARTLLSSAARTATTSSADQTNYNHRGVAVFLNVTANPGGVETLTVSIECKNSLGVTYNAVTTFAAITPAVNAQYIFVLYPGTTGFTATTGMQVQPIPLAARTFRVTVTHSAGGSWTYTLSAQLLL